MMPTHRASLIDTDVGVLTGDLKILTLNVAHGRKEGLNQLLQSERTIRQNLRDIAAVLKQTGADVVALQEADGPSRWSGNFDHVAFIAEQAGYPWFYRAAHAESWLFTYGTAILSRFPMADGSVVKQLADTAHMKVYQPDAKHLQTYRKRGTRLDWILTSNELDFFNYEVLSDVISDHQAVIATIGWIQK